MDPIAAIEILNNYGKFKPERVEAKLAVMTARWITSMELLGRGEEAVCDPLTDSILGCARLFHDCGWERMRENSEVITVDCTYFGRGFKVLIRCGYTLIHVHTADLDSNEPQSRDRAALRGLYYALTYVRDHGMKLSGLQVHTNSKYALDCLEVFSPKWAAAGWIHEDRTPIQNADVLVPLFDIYQEMKREGILLS